MRCPECNETLREMTVSIHLVVPECPSCGGVWIRLEDWSLMQLCLDVGRVESTSPALSATGPGTGAAP